METLANLESFARSAETGSFSEAARRLALTPAAVSRNVAVLERNLGVRLFHRSTRGLALTEDGERFLQAVTEPLGALQSAICGIAGAGGEPAGMLRVSMSLTFGMDYILPLLPAFLALYPAIRPDWQFENRPVDLVAEGVDAAIGGGFPLAPGVVARPLAPVHVIAVAAPGYFEDRVRPTDPAGLAAFDGIVMRSARTGRVRVWTLRDAAGAEAPAVLRETLVLGDPEAMTRAALMGLGVTLVAVPHALPRLERGTLVRLLPRRHADAGPLSLYYASRTLLPAKTRAFVDFVTEAFRREGLAERFAGSIG